MSVFDQLHENLSVHLDEILKHFKPGAKVTVVIRNPSVPGHSGLVIGNDDLDEAIAEIRRRQNPEHSTITGLIDASSVGHGLKNIAENGLEAELADLDSELHPKRRRKRK